MAEQTDPPCVPITVHTFGLTREAWDAAFGRVAKAAHEFDEQLFTGGRDSCLQCEDEPTQPTWRDVFRAMRAERVRLRPFGDTSDAPDHRVWQLVDRHGNELGHVAHETGYWGEEWTVSFSFECGPSTHIGAAALDPADVLALARISGLIGGPS